MKKILIPLFIFLMLIPSIFNFYPEKVEAKTIAQLREELRKIEEREKENSSNILKTEAEIKIEIETEPETEAVTEVETEMDTEPETVIEEKVVSEDIFAINAEEDIFANAKLREDKIISSEFEDDDDYKDFAYFPEHSSKSGIVQEVSATISELVKLNKAQRQKLMSYEEQMDQMADTNRRMNDKLREQTRDYEKLRTTAENFKTVVSKLEAKCEVLEGKNEALEAKTHDQERTIYRLTAENTSLREQSINNDMLAQVLAEARSALDGDDNEISYYRKAA